jgi:ubiquinone biosynthesis accessory factor UbiJ
MFEAATQLLGPALLERLTLMLNHVLASEPMANERLRAHVGRTMVLEPEGVPGFLPPPPPAAWRITPAGLLERIEELPAEADLRMNVDVSNPLMLATQWLAGQRQGVSIQGDAELAATVAWLMENLRWDFEDDLARVFGDVPGRQFAQVLRTVGERMLQALKALARLAVSTTGPGPSKDTPGARRPS